MGVKRTVKYYALTLTHKIGQIEGFDTEADLDKFGFETSTFTEEEKQARAAEGDLHGPPIVLALIADNLDSVSVNNFELPFAVYLKGEKFRCVKQTAASTAKTIKTQTAKPQSDQLQQ